MEKNPTNTKKELELEWLKDPLSSMYYYRIQNDRQIKDKTKYTEIVKRLAQKEEYNKEASDMNKRLTKKVKRRDQKIKDLEVTVKHYDYMVNDNLKEIKKLKEELKEANKAVKILGHNY